MQVFVVQAYDGYEGHEAAEAAFGSREAADAHVAVLSKHAHRTFVVTEVALTDAAASPDLRTIIREEIRAALDGAEQAKEQRLYGPRPELVGNTLRNQIGLYGKALNATPQQTYDRSALNRKQ
jgi:hypothetical protein